MQLRVQQLILPIVLLLALPSSMKLWFCLPLLAAWSALVPQYRNRRALDAAAIFAAVVAIAQALLFGLGFVGTLPEAHGTGQLALIAMYLLLVLWLDGRVLWEVRKSVFPREALPPA